MEYADFGPQPRPPVKKSMWEVAHGVRNQIAQARLARHRRNQALDHACVAGNRELVYALSRIDPLFRRTIQLLIDYLHHQPPSVFSHLSPQVNRDPRMLLELYGAMRHYITMTASSVQKAGSTGSKANNVPRQQQFADIKAKINSVGAGPGDLEKYLDLLGVGDKMIG